jgi:TAT (twin-arginine translocation) pathway signal sequence
MDDKPDITRRQFIKGSALASAGLLVPREPMGEQAHAESLAPPGAGPGFEDGTTDSKNATLENAWVRIELNPQTGDIKGLYNQRTGKQYIAAQDWTRAFRLNVPFPKRVTGYNADYSPNSLDSWTQSQCDMTREREKDSQTLKVHYP